MSFPKLDHPGPPGISGVFLLLQWFELHESHFFSSAQYVSTTGNVGLAGAHGPEQPWNAQEKAVIEEVTYFQNRHRYPSGIKIDLVLLSHGVFE